MAIEKTVGVKTEEDPPQEGAGFTFQDILDEAQKIIRRLSEKNRALGEKLRHSEASAEAWRRATSAWAKAADSLIASGGRACTYGEAPRLVNEATKASLEAFEADRPPFAGEPRSSVSDEAQGRK